MPGYRDALGGVIERAVAPAAAEVDRDGVFPVAGIEALGQAGLLGLTCAPEVGGGGAGLRAAAEVVEGLAGVCGSTAMVALMHYCGAAVLEAHGPPAVRRAVAAGDHLTTLAFSEAGSRSHFWAPVGTATRADGAAGAAGGVRLDAQKSWVTSAGRAASFVWSSRPLAGEGPMSLWLVPGDAPGLSQPGGFDGLGLRGNGSTPVTAEGVLVPESALLGPDGGGLDLALSVVLPTFLVLSAAFSVGLMAAVTADAAGHLRATRFTHTGQTLADQPVARRDFARMRVETDRTRALLLDTLGALESGREDALLRVLEVKAAAGESALDVTDLALKLGGGAAFRKELGIERRFRDARAARVMAPTTDALLDFVARTQLGLPLLDEANA
jgi:alkylation response protein AidB-like acyl-CoA dehydrogenase